MAFSREISTTYQGHEVILAVGYKSKFWETRLKLYIDSRLVDESTFSVFAFGEHKVRGTIPERAGPGIPVKGTMKLRLLGGAIYRIVIGGVVIVEKKGPWHSL